MMKIAAIVAAILLSQPAMSRPLAASYARTISKEAREHSIDPLTMVAMIHYESRWNASIERNDCVGLGQICLSTQPECKAGTDNNQCESTRLELKNGHHNIKMMASFINMNRDFCKRKTGRAETRHWLASYGGFNEPGRGVYCGRKKVRGRWVDVPTHRLVRRVTDLAQKLRR